MVTSLLRNRAMQEPPKLAPEVVSLVHHIELNKAGWWIKGLRRLIIAALWTAGRAQAPAEIVSSLRDLFAVEITTAELQRHLDNLCSTSQLLRMPNGAFNVTQACREKLEKEMRDARELEQKAESSFAALIASHCPQLDTATVWMDFRERLLEPMIHDLGAETYQLLTGGTFHAEKKRTDAFLDRYTADARPGLLLSISAFLDPKNSDVRAYTLRCMNAHFFVQAARLSEDVITKLGKLSKLNPTFRLYVDTNFVFSVFGLNDNPQADSALSLTQLREQLSGKASIQFHVLQPTVDEARKVLISMKTSARSIRFTRNIVDAATVADMSGIMGRYLEEARRTGWQVTSDDFFDPLINNFISISRSKGIELHNEKLDRYRTKPELVDDINDQLAYEQATFGAEAKTYEKLEHDLVLWHFVNDQRSAHDESPLDARCWVVTMDYRLINFDAHKRRRGGHPVPICVHPVALLQMLQFWIPRNNAFDEAMLSAMRYPLLSHDFDIDSEKVTVKILTAISQWSNASALSKEAVTNILMNTALRDKLASAANDKEEQRLVREALGAVPIQAF